MASNGSNGGVPPRGRPPPPQQNAQQAGPALPQPNVQQAGPALPQQNAHQARPAAPQQNVQQQLNPLFQVAGGHANLALGWLEDVPEPRRNMAESVIWPKLHSRDDQDADG